MPHEGLSYLGRVMAAPAVVAVLGGAAGYSGHHMADVPALMVRALVMAIASLPLGVLLFRPIAGYLRAPGEQRLSVRRVQRLPLYSGAAMFSLSVLTIASYVGHVHGSWAVLARGEPKLLLAMVAHVALFAGYIGLFVYFTVLDYTVGLRALLWSRWHLTVPAAPGRIGGRIVFGFAAVAIAPLLLFLADAVDGSAGTAGPVAQALTMDLAAAALLSVVLVVVFTRTVSRPVRMLLEGVQRVDAGDLTTRVAVASDDELGSLTERFNRMVAALAERDKVRRTFSRFVPAAVADALIADEGAIAPQERDASILYADIEGFTRLASTLPPTEILTMLNEHFEHVAEVVHAHGGVITQFQGDAVLAAFNLPAPAPDHAHRAVAAATKLLDRLAARGSRYGIRVRIGIATGRVVGGTVGGGDRLGYTLHGDTVNLAARLEAMNKEMGTRILVDGFTADRLQGIVALRDRGTVGVRGLPVPVRIYEPMGAPRSSRVDPGHKHAPAL